MAAQARANASWRVAKRRADVSRAYRSAAAGRDAFLVKIFKALLLFLCGMRRRRLIRYFFLWKLCCFFSHCFALVLVTHSASAEGWQFQNFAPSPSRRASALKSLDSATSPPFELRCKAGYDQKPLCGSAASPSSIGPNTLTLRCPLANTSRHGSENVGFSGWSPVNPSNACSDKA